MRGVWLMADYTQDSSAQAILCTPVTLILHDGQLYCFRRAGQMRQVAHHEHRNINR
jgi:hypothetical protein